MPGVRPNCDCVCTPFGHHPKAGRILLLETDIIAQAGMHITTISCTKRVKRSSKSAFDKQLRMYPNRAYVKNQVVPKGVPAVYVGMGDGVGVNGSQQKSDDAHDVIPVPTDEALLFISLVWPWVICNV